MLSGLRVDRRWCVVAGALSCIGCNWLRRKDRRGCVGQSVSWFLCVHPDRDPGGEFLGRGGRPDEGCPAMEGTPGAAASAVDDEAEGDLLSEIFGSSTEDGPQAGWQEEDSGSVPEDVPESSGLESQASDLMEPESTCEAELADSQQAAEVVEVSGASIPVKWQRFGNRLVMDQQTSEAVWISVLTVPDVQRFPVQEVVPASEAKPVDLQGLDRLSGADIKAVVSETLPDDQLQALADFVFGQERPKKVAADAIRQELIRRMGITCDACGQPVQSFAAWLEKHARDHLSCRVVAVAVALGSSEPEVLVAETDSDAVESSCSENDLLSMVWSWLDGSREVGSADFASLWQILRVRSLAVDCSDRRTNSVFPIYSQASISRLAEELAAFGLGEGFPVPSAAMVFSAWRDHRESALETMAVQQLEAERALVLASRTVF